MSKPKTKAKASPKTTTKKRRYKPPACGCCKSPDTGVYSTERGSSMITRYLKCDNCGYTWADRQNS